MASAWALGLNCSILQTGSPLAMQFSAFCALAPVALKWNRIHFIILCCKN